MIEFYGYNNGKAIAIRNQYNMQLASIISSFPCVIVSIVAIIIKEYMLFLCWVLPVFFFILSLIALLFEKYDTEVFLQGEKQKHKFKVDGYKFNKDGKEIKSLDFVKVREYKKFIFLELKQSDYVIYKNELACSPKDLIEKIKEIKKHYEDAKSRLIMEKTEQDVYNVYEQLKNKYDLVLTTTAKLNEGFIIDCPIIVGKAHDQIIELYECDGMFVMIVKDSEENEGTHWHPREINDAINDIVEFMNGKLDYRLHPYKKN